MIGSIVHQLMKDATIEEIKEAGLDGYYADHGKGIYPIDASGVPYDAKYFAVTGDPIADLYEDMAADETTTFRQSKLKIPVYVYLSVLCSWNCFSNFYIID